jgi:uncharacterized Fe-S center protein
MTDFLLETVAGKEKPYVESLRQLLGQFQSPFALGDSVGIKLHWGERGNRSYLPADYAKEIASWLQKGRNHLFLIQRFFIPVADAPLMIP